MVDEADSKSVGGDIVWVRVPPPAPNKYNPNQIFRIGKGFGLFVYVLIGLSQQADKLVFEKMLSLRESSAHWSWQSPG